MNENELIVVKQLPIIEENLKKATKLYLFALVFLWYLAYI